MIRISTRTASVLCSVVLAGISHAAPYYLSWTQLYNDTAAVSQFPHAMALDSHGNVFVTGHAIVGSAKGFYTAKYDALDGHVVWSKQLNGAGTNEFIANAIAVDSMGDCVVTGSRNVAGSIDYYTVKYSGVDGTLVWQKSFDGANQAEDDGLKVVCDGANNVIVTGKSVGNNGSNSTGFDWVTIKYQAADGMQLFKDSYTQTSSNLDDIPAGLAVDSSNNVYVTGTVQTALNVNRLYVRKLKAADLTKLWDIIPINTAGAGDAEGGGTAVAVDSANSVVVTSSARDAANHFGYFTIKYDSLGAELWRSVGPFSNDTFGIPYAGSSKRSNRPQPIGVAIGPDNSPIVTGTLLDASGNAYIRTIKYTSGGFFQAGSNFWPAQSLDTGLGFGDTVARAITADGAGNALVVGESENADGNTDVYIAKYDSLTGEKVFSTAFNGSFNSSADTGVDIAIDDFGHVSALGDFVANKGTGIGLHEFGTIKHNRLIAPTAEDLPDGITGVADTAKITLAGAPAIGASGVLATKLTFKAGTKAGAALLVEGSGAGGTLLPAVKGQPAPVGMNEAAANWVSFSDPVVAPNGHYAFAAKVSGPASKANGVWGKLNGNLIQILRQGSVIPVTASTDKLASVTNFGLSSNSLIALVKLAGPAATSTAVLRVDNGNSGAVLLRTGQSGLMINSTDYTVKGITLFSPAPSEPGDGRWQGAAGMVARVTAVKTNDPKTKATAIVSIANGGGPTTYFYTGQTVGSDTYSAFGLPSTATGTQRFTVKATLAAQPAATNAALIYCPSIGTTPNAYARKGAVTNVIGLPSTVTYGDFSDPLVNTNSLVAFIATLKGSATDVKPTSNKCIVFGGPTGLLVNVARTGDFAPDASGAPSTAKWTAFTALALPGGVNSGPVFLGKLNTPKNNIGLWARDSRGNVRRLILTGDHLDDQVVKTITVLNTLPKVMAAARSFDGASSIAVALTFTDHKTAILRIGIP